MKENIVGFDKQEQQKPTNQDIIVTFTPDTSTKKYEYQLFKDNKEVDTIYIDEPRVTTIIMDETGIYEIKLTTYDTLGNKKEYQSGKYHIDKEKPVIEVGNQLITMQKGDNLDLFADIKAYDEKDGDLTKQVTTNYHELDFSTLGVKKLVYTVVDEAGNVATKTVNVNVVSGVSDTLIYIQIGIFIILLLILYFILSFRRSIKLERRISRYSIEPIKDNTISLTDSLMNLYHKMIFHLSNIIKKSVFVQKYSKKYDKYTAVSDEKHKTGLEIVATKTIVAFTFLLVAIFSKTIQYKIISPYEIFIPLLVGFFVPDIIYITKYKLHRKRIENDLLQAIIIMNNAFKSGRSITQAIQLVTTELDGPIAEEFKKMNLEISFGLGIDVVFDRFSKRINLEEVTYLTASLTILNKTGGNIIKVFSSIEKSLFNKKKLNLELQALIGSSKLIVYVLFLVPLFFIVLVSLINPTYFVPFFTNPVGLILLGLMILFYILYIVIVRKVMKVRM